MERETRSQKDLPDFPAMEGREAQISENRGKFQIGR